MLGYIKKKIKAYIDIKTEQSEQELKKYIDNQTIFLLQKMNLDLPKKQYLFICGFARSATTILMDILNSSDEALIGSEINVHLLERNANLFSSYSDETIEEQFNNRKIAEGDARSLSLHKSSHLTGKTLPADYQLVHFFQCNSGNYRIVGDKIALSDAMYNGETSQAQFESFSNKYRDSIFLFTLRSPGEVLCSFKKMFPGTSFYSVSRALIDTYRMILSQFLFLDRAYIIFADDVVGDLLPELESLLDTKLTFSGEKLGAPFKGKHDIFSEETGFSSEEINLVESMEKVFGEIKSTFLDENTFIKKSKSDFVAKKIARINENIEQIKAKMLSLINT